MICKFSSSNELDVRGRINFFVFLYGLCSPSLPTRKYARIAPYIKGASSPHKTMNMSYLKHTFKFSGVKVTQVNNPLQKLTVHSASHEIPPFMESEGSLQDLDKLIRTEFAGRKCLKLFQFYRV